MPEDVAPGILQDLEEKISENNADRRAMTRLQVKAEKGQADFRDANEFARLRGKAVRNAIADISSSDLPNGQMYYNIASRTLEPVLTEMNQDVLDIAEAATKAANEAAGIGLKPVVPDMSDNVKRLVDKAASELWDDIRDEVAAAAETMAHKDVDETIRENARFQYESGLDPKVERIASAGACKWCREQAGTHAYTRGADYFRRHANCECEIWFEPGKRGGSRELVSSATYRQNLDSLTPEEREQHAQELRLRKNARERERYRRNRGGAENLTPEERERRAEERAESSFEIYKSVGAAPRNYDILDPSTGEYFHFIPGTRVNNIETFAGYGTRDPLKEVVIEGLSEEFHTTIDLWKHCKGTGHIDVYGSDELAEVHWFQHPDVGKVKFRVKKWLT